MKKNKFPNMHIPADPHLFWKGVKLDSNNVIKSEGRKHLGDESLTEGDDSFQFEGVTTKCFCV